MGVRSPGSGCGLSAGWRVRGMGVGRGGCGRRRGGGCRCGRSQWVLRGCRLGRGRGRRGSLCGCSWAARRREGRQARRRRGREELVKVRRKGGCLVSGEKLSACFGLVSGSYGSLAGG